MDRTKREGPYRPFRGSANTAAWYEPPAMLSGAGTPLGTRGGHKDNATPCLIGDMAPYTTANKVTNMQAWPL